MVQTAVDGIRGRSCSTRVLMICLFIFGGCGNDSLNVGYSSHAIGVLTNYSATGTPPSIPHVGANQSYTDPVFGTKIIRVTDVIDNLPPNGDQTFEGNCYNAYGYWPAFNSDDSRLLIACNSWPLLYTFNPTTDSVTYLGTLRDGKTPNPDFEGAYWSHTNPNIIYAIANPDQNNPSNHQTGLYKIDITKHDSTRFTLLHNFASDISALGLSYTAELYQLGKSDDDANGNSVFTMMTRQVGNIKHIDNAVFAYYQSTNTVQVWQRPTAPPPGQTGDGFEVDESQMAKTSDRVVMSSFNSSGYYNQAWAVWNLATNTSDFLLHNGVDRPGGHYDPGYTLVNDDVWNGGVQKRQYGNPNVHNPQDIFLYKQVDGVTPSGCVDDHVGMRNDDETYAAVATYWQNYCTTLHTHNPPDCSGGCSIDYTQPFANEIFLTGLAGTAGSPLIARLAHTRATATSDYYHQAWPAVDRLRNYIVFHSDFGGGSAGKTDVFIVRIPDAYRPGGSPCTSPLVQCPGDTTCIDTSSNPSHCGNCTTACPPAASCTNSLCVCPTGQAQCGNACVNKNTDPANCGTCGHACTAGQTCASGVCTSSTTTTNLTGTDIDGDHKGDFLARDASGNVQVWKSSGTTESNSTTYSSYYTDAAGWNTSSRIFALDFNGDGKTDVLARSYNGAFDVDLSNGTNPVANGAFQTTLSDANGWNADNRIFPADINGDGKWDLLARQTDGTWQMWLSNGTALTNSGTFTSYYTDTAGWGSGNRFYMLDVNGDGKTDFIARAANGGWDVNISTGSSYTIASSSFSSTYTDTAGYNSGYRFFVVDVNGDHKADLLARHADGTFDVLLSNGTTLVYNTNFTSYFTDASGFNTGNRFIVRDVNADGKTDLIMRYANGSFEEWFSNGTIFYSAYTYTSPLTDAAGWSSGVRFY